MVSSAYYLNEKRQIYNSVAKSGKSICIQNFRKMSSFHNGVASPCVAVDYNILFSSRWHQFSAGLKEFHVVSNKLVPTSQGNILSPSSMQEKLLPP